MFKVIYNNSKLRYVHILDTADYSVDKVLYADVEYMVKNLDMNIKGVYIENDGRLTFTVVRTEIPKVIDDMVSKYYRIVSRERLYSTLRGLQVYFRCNLITHAKQLLQGNGYNYLVRTIGDVQLVTGEFLANQLSKFLKENENEIGFGDCDIIYENDSTFTIQQDYKYGVRGVKQIRGIQLNDNFIKLTFITQDGNNKVLNVPYKNRNCSILRYPE